VDTHECIVEVPIFPNKQNITELAADVDAYMDRSERLFGYLIAGHGFYTWGGDITEALRHVEAFEFLSDCELRLRGVSQP
jgi:methylthioribulose-1-phosphate dehydratase